MTGFRFTGGKVVYGRQTRPGDFESRRSEIEVSFAIEEGSDVALDEVISGASETIQQRVHDTLGLAPATKPRLAAPAAPVIAGIAPDMRFKTPETEEEWTALVEELKKFADGATWGEAKTYWLANSASLEALKEKYPGSYSGVRAAFMKKRPQEPENPE